MREPGLVGCVVALGLLVVSAWVFAWAIERAVK
jgi:hypothetical protein